MGVFKEAIEEAVKENVVHIVTNNVSNCKGNGFHVFFKLLVHCVSKGERY